MRICLYFKKKKPTLKGSSIGKWIKKFWNINGIVVKNKRRTTDIINMDESQKNHFEQKTPGIKEHSA